MASSKEIGIGLLGLGTVGSGVVKSLRSQAEIIAQRVGIRPQVQRILVRDVHKPRAVQVNANQLTTAADSVLQDPEVAVIIEVIGGIEPARSYILQALRAGKHVITANKELLAKHGDELTQAARSAGVRLMYEASVAGGIPIVRMVESYLTANRISAIRGILNGTCNYILTQMDERGQTFAEALLDAQRLGYAEADPESDIEGYDAAYKLCILANLAFPIQTPMWAVGRVGITAITPLDLQMARALGATLKLIGSATYAQGQAQLHVGPRFLAQGDALASVRDVFNAVTLTADVVGDLTFIGRGAGELPTASAVIEDLMEVLRTPTSGTSSRTLVSSDSQDEVEAIATEDAVAQSTHRTTRENVYARFSGRHMQLAVGWRERLTACAERHAAELLYADCAEQAGEQQIVLLLRSADVSVLAACEQELCGECVFYAPFDATLPAAWSAAHPALAVQQVVEA